ncbi:MAG: NAD(P)-dependent alcohol dehydrogenase [Micromonosporaceae bacterium]
MKAIVQDSYGSSDVLRLHDIDRPVAGDNQLLVRVHAAGVDRGVLHLMTGLPYLLRAFGYGVRAPKVPVRGREVAGRVEAVGAKVTSFQPGDEVYGICEGSFAEYATVREDRAAPKPASLSLDQAAALPISGVTALHAVRDAGQVKPGQTVLIIGAAGGVGTLAVQLAKAYGAEVTGVCSTTKLDLVRSIGADHVIDYTREEIGDGDRRYDVILDTAGNRPLSQLRRALTPRGTLVIVGGEEGGRWLGGIQRSLSAAMLSPFVRHTLRGLMPDEGSADLRVLGEYADAGTLTPVVDRTYPLSETAKAIRYLEEGHARGKVVITV